MPIGRSRTLSGRLAVRETPSADRLWRGMSPAAVSGGTLDKSGTLSSAEGGVDVQVNVLGIDELFGLYERTGFLYPAKAARLRPHLDTVRENWRRMLQAGDALMFVLSAGHDDGCASITVWRTTGGSWVWQHLVSEGNPLRSRAVILGGLARNIRGGISESIQNWFRPDNRYPARVFGTMVSTIGDSQSSVRSYMFFAIPRHAPRPVSGPDSVRVVPYDGSHDRALRTLATTARGPLYVRTEELDRDVELQSLDRLYRTVGLRRTRHVWLAYQGRADVAVGAAIAYRGPLGVNFSFIENRCDLLLQPALGAADAFAVTSALVGAARTAYSDFELDDIPVVADGGTAEALQALGGQFLRNYCQGITLKDGQPLLYRHVDQFYARLRHRLERRVAPSTLSA
jgi:hypothetical protein